MVRFGRSFHFGGAIGRADYEGLWRWPSSSLSHWGTSPQRRGHRRRRVLPPQARPFGYSLADMASANALFTYTGNDPANYPDTPIQVLYADLSTFEATEVDGCVHVTLSNEFTTSVRTFYYVPILNNSDIPPIHGVFPTTAAEARAHFFGPDALAGQYEVVVDGSATPIGPAYVAAGFGAARASEGRESTHSACSHAPSARNPHDRGPGNPHRPAYGGGLGAECLSFEFTYTVHVVLPG